MKEQALYIVEKLQNAGYQAVFAGGCVRDMYLGITPNDYDVATNALPEIVESLFERTLAVGKSFGVIVVLIDGFEIEVATFRSDGESSDGRHPDSVTFSTMKEDALRRDLTINGMFYDPIEKRIYDFVGGHKDLLNNIVRLIGNPEDRIKEDKLRMLRVVRFASRFKFAIASDTLEAVSKHAHEITDVSAERILDELLKILRAKNFGISIDLLFQTNLIEYILPEVKAMKGVEQPADYHPEGDVLTHTILALEYLPEDASDELLMATLLHDVGKPPTQVYADRIRFNEHDIKGADLTREILKRLKCSNDFSDHVIKMVKGHMKFMQVKDMRTSTLRRFFSVPKFNEHMLLHRSDCMSSHKKLDNLEFLEEKMKIYEPMEPTPVKNALPPRLFTGADLLAMGFKQGPIFKTILVEVEQAIEYVSKKFK
jgi:poly(A) polymerase